MIPYDDLVIALATWRARQGLPVAQLSGALTPPPVAPAPVAPPAMIARTAPPSAPPARAAAPVAAPPPKPIEDPLDVDDSALLEEAHYEAEGSDFALTFAATEAGESTAIGVAPPPRGAEVDGDADDLPPRRGGRDW